ncbi:COX15/CtaA family protein [Paenibacillus guangzhouensis]|uniref:COX15/CtaA family protein n=1 Tax=Paenibacillus guangzhouensis TaxID=1473112 RepID=UPI0012669906|nr:COX15/CtaA family protein [Paenibacillus guangzhouensis]
MITTRYRWLAWSTFIGMFLVLLAGALVTKTGSGRGCGDDWPLCNGKFIPAYTVESLIEYSHRMVTGIVGILVLLTFLYTWRYLREHTEAIVYAGGTLLFTVVQALMGAAAVLWPQQPAVMALHFGISLLAVASSMLLVVWIRRLERMGDSGHSTFLPKSMYFMSWGIWVFCYVVVYLGAYIRHLEVEAGCMGWPLCNGQLIPYLGGASGIVFLHRVAAAVLFLLIAGFYFFVRRRETNGEPSMLRKAAMYAIIFVVAQIFSGGLLNETIHNEDVYLFASLLHNVLATALFSILTDIAIRSWKHRIR